MEDASPSDRHLRKIGMHVSAYIAHVRTQLKQTIPKAIVHCLVSIFPPPLPYPNNPPPPPARTNSFDSF